MTFSLTLLTACSADVYLLRVGLLRRQRARLLVQSLDDRPVAGNLLGHVLVFLHQSLGGELVMADVHAGDDPQHIQHPRVDVVSISLHTEVNSICCNAAGPSGNGSCCHEELSTLTWNWCWLQASCRRALRTAERRSRAAHCSCSTDGRGLDGTWDWFVPGAATAYLDILDSFFDLVGSKVVVGHQLLALLDGLLQMGGSSTHLVFEGFVLAQQSHCAR